MLHTHDKKEGPRYQAPEWLIEAMENVALRHEIFSFAGPLAALPVHMVFKYPMERWLYSWMEEQWYPALCNGREIISKNVFVKIPLTIIPARPKSLSPEKPAEDLKEFKDCLHTRIFHNMENENPWCGMKFRSGAIINSEESWLRAIPGDEDDAQALEKTSEILGISGEGRDTTEIWPEDLDVQVESGLKVSLMLNALPDEGSITVNCWSFDTSSLGSTHFIRVALLEVDIMKILYISSEDFYNERNPGGLISKDILSECEELHPIFQHWMWKICGYREEFAEYLQNDRGSVVCYHGEPLPLEVALFRSGYSALSIQYERYMKEGAAGFSKEAQCLKGPSVASFLGENPMPKGEEFPAWYLLYIGALELGDVKASPENVSEAIRNRQLRWAEVFLRRGDVSSTQDIGGIMGDILFLAYQDREYELAALKLVDRCVKVDYAGLRWEIAGLGPIDREAPLEVSFINRIRSILSPGCPPITSRPILSRTDLLPLGRKLFNRDFLHHLIETKGVEYLLPPPLVWANGRENISRVYARIEKLASIIPGSGITPASPENVALLILHLIREMVKCKSLVTPDVETPNLWLDRLSLFALYICRIWDVPKLVHPETGLLGKKLLQLISEEKESKEVAKLITLMVDCKIRADNVEEWIGILKWAVSSYEPVMMILDRNGILREADRS